MPQRHALVRSSSDRMIAGVCAGIAEHFGWSVPLVRAGYVVLSIMSAAFPGLLVYLVLWAVIPSEPRERRRFRIDDDLLE